MHLALSHWDTLGPIVTLRAFIFWVWPPRASLRPPQQTHSVSHRQSQKQTSPSQWGKWNSVMANGHWPYRNITINLKNKYQDDTSIKYSFNIYLVQNQPNFYIGCIQHPRAWNIHPCGLWMKSCCDCWVYTGYSCQTGPDNVIQHCYTLQNTTDGLALITLYWVQHEG